MILLSFAPPCDPKASFTYLRATLESVKETANVTLSLPETLLRRFRVFAAARNQSMSSLMTVAIRDLIEEDAKTQRAKHRFLERIRNAPDRGTRGKIQWTRDELHER
jgi:hypothetical protein